MSENDNTELNVANAARVVEDLQARSEALAAASRELAEKRKSLAYLAVAQKDAGAIKQLAHNAVEANKLSVEMLDVGHALAVAESRVAEAERARVREADKENALALRVALAEFLEASESLDEVLLALGEEGKAVIAAAAKMRACGCEFPTGEQVRVLGLKCLLTSLSATPWSKEFSPIAPRDRRSWATMARDWANRIEQTNIQPRLAGAGVVVTDEVAA
jgi:hypothetical protein